MSSASPTVIVSRRPREGMEQKFGAWNQEIRSAASQFEGFVGSELQAPGEAHPNEWVTVYRFDTQQNLDNWLDSAERTELILSGQDLMDGPTREQRVALTPDRSDAVTAVISQRIAPEDLEDFKRAEGQIVSVMSTFPGFVALEHADPVSGVQEEYVVSFTFASRQALDNWLESEERQLVLKAVDPFVEGDRTLNVVGGFGGWFVGTGERAPLKWKSAIAVLLALYPTTLTLGLLQRAFLPEGVPWWVALLGSNILGVAVLTWLLMPRLTAALADWLRR